MRVRRVRDSFLLEIIESAGMPRLTRMIVTVWDQVSSIADDGPADLTRKIKAYRRILRLARARKGDALTAVLAEHYASHAGPR